MDRQRVLMCRPTYYAVEYRINFYMHPDKERVNSSVAHDQWETLYHLVRQVGFEVELINPHPAALDMVFTANAGIVVPSQKKFILPRFDPIERQIEEPLIERWALARGYEVVHLPANLQFEGEGDAFVLDNVIVGGYGVRSSLNGLEEVAKVAGMELMPLRLCRPEWYHLDTCFTPLRRMDDDKWLVAYVPEAFDDKSVLQITETFHTIRVSEKEAKRLACNAVVKGNTVILPAGNGEFARELMQNGFTVYEAPMTEFLKSGGSCKCLVLYLD